MYLRKNKLSLHFALILLVVVCLSFSSCGGGGYDNPQAKPPSVMVSAATLNLWATNGYGTDARGYNKMVILDVTTADKYNAGHVPGSYLLDTATDLAAKRNDGVGDTISMVATQSQMNTLIQRTGIDERTVIVFTTEDGGGSLMSLSRAYFNFRYWGFPKERLKVLDGSKAVYKASFPLSTEPTLAPTPSTYSVCLLAQDTSVRAPLAEMIVVAEDNDLNTVVLDSRSPNEYNGVAGSTKGPGGTDFVAFEGHIRTAINQNYTELINGNTNTQILSKQTLTEKFTALGINGSKTSYPYCRTSYRGAITFLVLDGILGYPVKLYDGAWIEWGQMADESYDGALKSDSPWKTNTSSRSEAITYNKEAGKTVEKLLNANSYALRADMVNVSDSTACGTGSGNKPIAPGY